MNLTQLRYFVKLAEFEHYGRASKELFISQPALSNAIKQLEADLGFKLFERRGRNVALTDQGREFKLHVNNALRELDKGINLESNEEGKSRIGLASVPSINKEFLPEILSSFEKESSFDASFDVWGQRTSSRCLEALAEGQVDFVFCGSNSSDQDMRWVPVLPQWLYAVVNPDHEFANCEMLSLNDLKGFSVISYRAGAVLHRPIKQLSETYGFSVREAFEDEVSALTQILSYDVNSVALIVGYVESSLKEQVRFIPIKELRAPFHTVYFGYKVSVAKSLEQQAFIDFIENRSISDAGIAFEREDGHAVAR